MMFLQDGGYLQNRLWGEALEKEIDEKEQKEINYSIVNKPL
jgi:hypothetical protein